MEPTQADGRLHRGIPIVVLRQRQPGGKLSLQESVMSPEMPRSIIYVATELTRLTGVTMPELRFRRVVWFLADLDCPARKHD